MPNPKGKGGFKPLPEEKLRKLLFAFSDTRFSTIGEIAVHLNISRNTVVKYLKDFARSGALSKNNWHLTSIFKKSPSVIQRLAARKREMLFYILNAARSGQKVSVNELQRKFGGEKKFASAVLAEAQARVNKSSVLKKAFVISHRTKSDQPKRRRLNI